MLPQNCYDGRGIGDWYLQEKKEHRLRMRDRRIEFVVESLGMWMKMWVCVARCWAYFFARLMIELAVELAMKLRWKF